MFRLARFQVPDCLHTRDDGRCRRSTCRYSLLPEWSPKRFHRDREPPADAETCALEVAEEHPDGLTLESVGALLGGMTRERVRQIEAQALRKVKRAARLAPNVWTMMVPDE